MKKILITGVSGYIAPYLCKALLINGNFEITGLYNSHTPDIEGVSLVKCNLADSAELEKLIHNFSPDVIYHLASVTPTRITDQTDDYISYFNGNVTAQIAKLSSELDALMIYTSTDLVYREGMNLGEDTSLLEPLTIYAKTKLEGERAIKEFAKKYIILRTSLVYGFTLTSYTSFFDVAYNSLKAGKEIRAFTDQFRNPLYTEDAADILVKLPRIYTKNDIINFCGSEYISRYEMCIAMCEEFGFDKKLVVPASADDFTAYPMVKELGLSTEKLKRYGIGTNGFSENLIRAKKYIP